MPRDLHYRDARAVFDSVTPSGEATPAAFSLDGYRYAEPIGTGGESRVYRAFPDHSDRAVAIKVLRHGTIASKPWLSREMAAYERLVVHGVPRLIEHRVRDGELILVREFIEGRTLAEVAEDPHVSRRERVALIVAISAIIARVHERGVIHRDLKPSNIVMDVTGQVWLLDLGVAHILRLDDSHGATLTETGTLLGTPAYMSPEQVLGRPPTTRSDVFGLGATALRLLAGGTPWDAEPPPVAQLAAAASGRVRDFRRVYPTLPRALAAVLQKACDPDPEKRYPSVADLGADLQRWLDGVPVEAGRGLWRRAVRVVAKNPIKTSIAVSVLIALLSLGGTSVGIQWLRRTPGELKVDPDNTWVMLESKGRNPLKTWSIARNDELLLAQAAKLRDGRRVAVLVKKGIAVASGLVEVWDVSNLDRALWTVAANEIIRSDAAETHSYVAAWATLADVFPGDGEDELIVILNHSMYYPSCVRVYDLRGKVRSEYWHVGRLTTGFWDSPSRSLFLAGCTNDSRAAQSLAEKSAPHYPEILMCIQPREEVIELPMLRASEPTALKAVRWYRVLDRGREESERQSSWDRIELRAPRKLKVSSGKPAVAELAMTFKPRGSAYFSVSPEGAVEWSADSTNPLIGDQIEASKWVWLDEAAVRAPRP